MMLTDRLLPRKLRQALFDWSRRYSGYDDHMAQAHPVPGYLEWGDVRFTIKTVTFSDGKMHVRADAGTTEAGRVRDSVRLVGTDGRFVLGGLEERDMGTKLSGSTWAFTWSVTLPATIHEAPDAPQPA